MKSLGPRSYNACYFYYQDQFDGLQSLGREVMIYEVVRWEETTVRKVMPSKSSPITIRTLWLLGIGEEIFTAMAHTHTQPKKKIVWMSLDGRSVDVDIRVVRTCGLGGPR